MLFDNELISLQSTGSAVIFDIPWPTYQLSDQEHEEGERSSGRGGRFVFKNRQNIGLPLHPFSKSELGDLLLYMGKYTWLDLQFTPASRSKLRAQMEKAMNRLKIDKQKLVQTVQAVDHSQLGGLSPEGYNQRKGIYQRYTGQENGFCCSIHVWTEHSQARAVLQGIDGKVDSVTAGQNGMRLCRYWIAPSLRNRIRFRAPLPFQKGLLLTADELAHLFHLPDGDHAIYGEEALQEAEGYLRPVYEGQERISVREFREGLPVGELIHPVIQQRMIRIPFENWTEMVFGAGKTGMGKSTFLLNALFHYLEEIWYDHKEARGFTYIDAKGQDYRKIIAKMLKDEQDGRFVDWKRVHVFDFRSSKYAPGLNLLHTRSYISTSTIVENALDILKNAFPDRESIWLDRIGKLALLSLLEQGAEHSILGLEAMVSKQDLFRQRVIDSLGEELKKDWDEVKPELENPQVSLPIFNRMQKIRYNQRLKRLFGQPFMDLDVRKWFDEGHIVLFNLAELSEEERKMIMGFIVTQYHQQSMTRSNTKEHFHFVDEFSLVQIPVVKQILSLGRSKGHCFVAMTQFTDQLEPDMVKALIGNVSTLIAVRQGYQDAKRMVQFSGGAWDAPRLQRLPRFTAAIQTSNLSGNPTTVYVQTKPLPLYKPNGKPAYFGPDKDRQKREEQEAINWVQAKVEVLMARDFRSIEEVDRWIDEYEESKTVLQKKRENPGDSLPLY